LTVVATPSTAGVTLKRRTVLFAILVLVAKAAGKSNATTLPWSGCC
jgi:hypothetical protein